MFGAKKGTGRIASVISRIESDLDELAVGMDEAREKVAINFSKGLEKVRRAERVMDDALAYQAEIEIENDTIEAEIARAARVRQKLSTLLS